MLQDLSAELIHCVGWLPSGNVGQQACSTAYVGVNSHSSVTRSTYQPCLPTLGQTGSQELGHDCQNRLLYRNNRQLAAGLSANSPVVDESAELLRTQCLNVQRRCAVLQDMSKEEEKRLEEELTGTYENISLDANGQALVERRDVWGGSGSSRSLGLRFG